MPRPSVRLPQILFLVVAFSLSQRRNISDIVYQRSQEKTDSYDFFHLK